MIVKTIQRSLRLKLLLLFLAMLVAILSIQTSIRMFWTLPQLRSLEMASDLKDVHRVETSVQRLFDELHSIAYDNAVWDEMYQRIQQRDGEYLDQNYLLKESFKALNINGFYFYDNQFNKISGLSADDKFTRLAENFFDQPTPLIQQQVLVDPDEVVSNNLAPVSKQGLLMLNDRPIMFVSSSIMPSNEHGNSVGTLLIWRFIDRQTVHQLKTMSQLPLTLAPVERSSSLPSGNHVYYVGQHQQQVTRAQDQTITLIFNDITEKPLLKINYQTPPRQYDNQLFDTSLIAGAVAAIIVLGIIFILLNYLLVLPIKKLQKTIKKVMNQKDYSQSTAIDRSDEIGLLAQLVDALFLNVLNQQKALISYNIKLKQLSDTDSLTGVANRRFLEEQFALLSRQPVATYECIAILMIDVDHFKQYNDTYGHTAGDKALKQVAECLQQQTRSDTDLVARYGGEEFVVLLREIKATTAQKVANKLCNAIEKLQIEHNASNTSDYITVSIGVAVCDQECKFNCDKLLRLADDALYQAKAEGRNRCIISAARTPTPIKE